ncbi:MAG: hypothetical protein R3D71_08030 [Rickettsiales bacterium]
MAKELTPLEQLTKNVIDEIENPSNHTARRVAGQKTFRMDSSVEQALKTIVKKAVSGEKGGKTQLDKIEAALSGLREDGDDNNLQYANHVEGMIKTMKEKNNSLKPSNAMEGAKHSVSEQRLSNREESYLT